MRLIKITAIKQRFVPTSTFYDLIAQGLMPRPIKVGRSSFWVEEEVEAAFLRLRDDDAPERAKVAERANANAAKRARVSA